MTELKMWLIMITIIIDKDQDFIRVNGGWWLVQRSMLDNVLPGSIGVADPRPRARRMGVIMMERTSPKSEILPTGFPNNAQYFS